MAEDFLSQEEIDALLGGGEEEKAEEKTEELVKPFDFSNIEHVKKGGLPGLEFIFTKWIKIFRDEIRKTVQSVSMVSINDIYITRFNSFMLKIPLPASYTIIAMKPLKESALLVLDSRLVFTIISVMFGGPPKPFKVEGREFTKLETKIVSEFITEVLATFESVWEPIYPLKIEVKSIELNPNLAKIVAPTEKVIVVELSVDLDGYEAPFFFCFPQSMFLPIKDFIYSDVSQLEKDIIWERTLAEKTLQIKVTLWLELCKKEVKIKDILKWDVGTELTFDVSPEDLLKMYVEDKPKFLAKLGQKKDRYAAMIEKLYERENYGE